MEDNFMSDEYQEDDIHLRTILDKYLVHWRWFVVAVAACLFAAYGYLRYTIPRYNAVTTILVKDEKKGGILSELSAFSDLGIGSGVKNNVDNEIEILKSRTLVESVVRKLSLNTSIVVKGKIVDNEIYKVTPITVNFSNAKPDFDTEGMRLKFTELTPNTFSLKSESNTDTVSVILKNKKEFRFGEVIALRNANLVITSLNGNGFRYKNNNKSVDIVVSPFENVVSNFLEKLEVTSISKTSSVVSISLNDAVVNKAEDFLNNLIQIYNEDAAADKNFISESTSKFIANRLILITQELDGVEQDVQSFKTSNQLTDIESEAKLFIEGSNDYNKKLAETEIQINVVTSMLDYMKKSGNADLLPSNIIAGQDEATGLISAYNGLVLQRNRILKSATVANPSVIKLDEQITSLKANVVASLNRLQSTLAIQKRDLNGREGLMNSKIGKIPVQERQFRVIARQQKVKEELYLYLLQKREETAITLAATQPNARVIDTAKASKNPVSPKKNIIYLAALLLGLLIPYLILYLMDLLDTKVKSQKDMVGKTQIPFIGDLPNSESPSKLIESESRTSTAEALRIIRTNLDFMLNEVPDGMAKTIMMTSTIPGEGKTFITVNLAAIFALSGKKVLLIGMDIRNPKLSDYFDVPIKHGLTNYLSSKNVSIADYITKAEGFDSLYVLPTGIIPPNPVELLMNKKVDELFAQLKKEYDYIIVDTAPVSLVTDTLIVAKHADTTVYVVRANHLDKRMLPIPERLYKENKLPNMALLLNDTQTKKGYGYGYGYGYGGYGYGGYGYGVKVEKKPWYKKIFNK
ncbi:GumC family protein [Flavobacterium soyangense]|uniref:non-specific protein-tyrosine kinase n=1 Tax=Flavobacterium soyangense TaxID=2023265 RepID=A0A930UCF5_9FLAO|nr:polysaccharide biosynthesis tyrosine autokinase [Flavobacterium soyangense]MBF2708194.1 polysaccharide biosynthesis tyrosine autokinase [Flavobacterium soyangense]